MKKLLFTIVLALACQLTYGQTAKAIFDDYKSEKKAQYVSVPHLMVSAFADKLGDNNVKAVLHEISSVKVLTLNDCRKGIRKGFVKKVLALGQKGYEEVTSMRDKKDNRLVLSKQGARYIEEVVVLVNDEDHCVGIHITGQINPEDLGAIVNMGENY